MCDGQRSCRNLRAEQENDAQSETTNATAIALLAGFRWHKKGEHTMVGSLLLGLFDDAGALQHVGVTASFTYSKTKKNSWSFSSLIVKMR